MSIVLDVSHFKKYFTIHHLNQSLPVFKDLSFQLHESEFKLISGPNGVGKSTLLRCLFRSYLPSGGSALYHSKYGPVNLATASDIDIAFLRSQEIGFVTQFLRPRPRVTALELVAEPLLSTGKTMDEAKDVASAFLDRFGFKQELKTAYPTTFSGGEQQKVNLARALIHPRRLLLLDEPTASLDKFARTALAERLKELKAEGVSMLGILHHPEDVAGLTDDDILLKPVHPLVEQAVEDMDHVAQ